MRVSQRRGTDKNAPIKEKVFNDDYFLDVIKSKGFGYGKKDVGNIEILNLRNLTYTLEDLLFQYVDASSEDIFPLFIVNQLLQKHGDLQTVERELLKIWHSVQQLKDQEMIAKIYQSFLSNQFKSTNIQFYVKTSRVILQNIIGDRYHDMSQQQLQQDMSQIFIPTDKIVDIVGKLFTTSSFINIEGDIPQINQSQITGNLFNNLKIILQEGRSMVNCQNLQIQCLLEFRAIEHKSYLAQMQSYTKNMMSSRRQTIMGGQALKINQKILQQTNTFYSFDQVLGNPTQNQAQYAIQRKKVNNVVEMNLRNKIINAGAGTMSTNQYKNPDQKNAIDNQEHNAIIESILNGSKKAKRQLISTPLLNPKELQLLQQQQQQQSALINKSKIDKSLMNIQELQPRAGAVANANQQVNQTFNENSVKFQANINQGANGGFNQSLLLFNETQQINSKSMAQNHQQSNSQQQQQLATYNAYQIKKMFNHEEARLLEAPETKLRELQLRVKEAEKEKQELKREQVKIIQELSELKSERQNFGQDKRFMKEIESLISNAYVDIQQLIEENLKMKEQLNQPQNTTKERKRKLKNTFDLLFQVLSMKQTNTVQSNNQVGTDKMFYQSNQQTESLSPIKNTSFDSQHKSSPQQHQYQNQSTLHGHNNNASSNNYKVLKFNNFAHSERSSIEQSSVSLATNPINIGMTNMQNNQLQPDSFTTLLMNFQTRPIQKMTDFFSKKLTNDPLNNNGNKSSNKPPELPPRDDFDEDRDDDDSSELDREEVRDKVHSRSNLKLMDQQQMNLDQKTRNSYIGGNHNNQKRYDQNSVDQIEANNDQDLRYQMRGQEFQRSTMQDNDYLDDGLISDLGSDIESVLERSIRGNLKQLLGTSIDSSINGDLIDKNTNMNRLPVPKSLSQSIKIDERFLAQFSNPQVFYIYTASEEFKAEEKRHLSLQKNQVFVGLKDFEEWIFGCKENDPRAFGFIPKNYLDFQREMKRND